MPERLRNKIRELHQRGVEAYDRGDYSVALGLLEELDSINPRMADVLNRLGIISNMDDDLKSAVEYLQRAVALNPSYTEAALNLTITYNELGEMDKAYEIFNRLSNAGNIKEGELDPYAAGKIANEHYRVGKIYLQFNRLDEAIEEFRKALKLRSGLADVQTKLGTALRENGDADGAITVLEEAVKTNPKYGAAWVQLGLAYYSLGNHPQANETWQRALKELPDLKEASTLLKLYEQEE